MLNKKALSETDIRTKFITPAIEKAGWDMMGDLREEVAINAGPWWSAAATSSATRSSTPTTCSSGRESRVLAVVEVKDNNHAVAAGLEQAEQHAKHLDAPFAFSSNGDAFAMLDRTGHGAVVQQSLSLDAFPSPRPLWERYRAWRGLPANAEALVEQLFHASSREIRYYQAAAVNRVIEAVAQGRRRALLVMATGTGKTWTAFQIAWRLKQAGGCAAHPLPRRSGRARVAGDARRLQPLRRHHDPRREPQGRPVLRGLLRALPVHGRQRR